TGVAVCVAAYPAALRIRSRCGDSGQLQGSAVQPGRVPVLALEQHRPVGPQPVQDRGRQVLRTPAGHGYTGPDQPARAFTGPAQLLKSRGQTGGITQVGTAESQAVTGQVNVRVVETWQDHGP